mmetsp:Transcript_20606/g.66065  ORF Transcript_20606/g.66065 Transcript_20606/m.66065 type:complete len:257 (-) Transcript_20606:1490-2260(-)
MQHTNASPSCAAGRLSSLCPSPHPVGAAAEEVQAHRAAAAAAARRHARAEAAQGSPWGDAAGSRAVRRRRALEGMGKAARSRRMAGNRTQAGAVGLHSRSRQGHTERRPAAGTRRVLAGAVVRRTLPTAPQARPASAGVPWAPWAPWARRLGPPAPAPAPQQQEHRAPASLSRPVQSRQRVRRRRRRQGERPRPWPSAAPCPAPCPGPCPVPWAAAPPSAWAAAWAARRGLAAAAGTRPRHPRAAGGPAPILRAPP